MATVSPVRKLRNLLVLLSWACWCCCWFWYIAVLGSGFTIDRQVRCWHLKNSSTGLTPVMVCGVDLYASTVMLFLHHYTFFVHHYNKVIMPVKHHSWVVSVNITRPYSKATLNHTLNQDGDRQFYKLKTVNQVKDLATLVISEEEKAFHCEYGGHECCFWCGTH